MFNLYDINTYDDVPDGLAVIEGEVIYNDKGEPLKWKDFTDFINALLIFLNRNGENITISELQLKNLFHRSTSKYKNEPHPQIDTSKIFKEFNNNFREYDRNKNMTDYIFSLAQIELIKHLSLDDINKLKKIIITHFNLREKKYRLQQDIFDNQIFIDNYLFTDLCYCNSLEDEQDIIFEYFSSFEDIESEKQIDEILNNDYLNQYPELKKEIKDSLIKFQLKK